MDFTGFNLVTITVVGVVVLGLVIIVAGLRNRVSKKTEAESEAATRKLYEEEDRAHADEDDGKY